MLEQTGISYGQLYRWKRKNLIPEDWFIRKSTFTGQETFFPKDQIIARVEKILGMKDDSSLDDIADMFSSGHSDVKIKKELILEHNIVTKATVDFFVESYGLPDAFEFEDPSADVYF